MKIQAVVTQSTTDSPPLINFANSNVDQDARETMAVVQRVVEDAGTDTKTFCRWLMSSKVKVGGPLSGICHWFTHPEKPLYRSRFHHGVTTSYDTPRHDDYDTAVSGSIQRTGLVSHLHESTSISIIMILATVLFILLITAFVTCIIRKKRRPQPHSVESPRIQAPMSTIVMRKDKPPDYNSVIQMKEKEDEELPSYSQAVCNISDVPGDRTGHDHHEDHYHDGLDKVEEESATAPSN